MTKKNYLVSAILMFIAAACFVIAAFAHFYCDNAFAGGFSAIAAVTDITAGIMNYTRYKKTNIN